MGNKSSMMLQDEEIKKISEETGFSPPQIEKLYSRFAHLDRSNCGSLSKDDLISIPELAINPLCDRLIQMFFADGEERINFRQFMRVLAAFRSCQKSNSSFVNNNNNKSDDINDKIDDNELATERNATRFMLTSRHSNNHNSHQTPIGFKNKLLFVFKIYDADDDGRISFNDLKSILKMMVGNYIDDARLDKIATRAFVEVDQDNDGFIEFYEFCKVFSGKDLDDKLRVKFF